MLRNVRTRSGWLFSRPFYFSRQAVIIPLKYATSLLHLLTTAPPTSKEVQDRSNLRARVLTGVVAGPLVLIATYLGGIPFLVIALLAGILTLLEFYALGTQRHIQGSVIIGVPALIALLVDFISGEYILLPIIFLVVVVAHIALEVIRHRQDSPFDRYRLGITLLGLVYAGFPPAFLVIIRALPNGLIWIYLIFAITWGTDTLAFFGGRLWGKHPLAPRISPKKTREGALVGVVGGALLGLILLLVTNQFTPALLLLVIIGPPIAVMGDLFESRLKRAFQVGDSHLAGLNIIPGHGGMMDRTDALTWVVTLFFIYFSLIGMMS